MCLDFFIGWPAVYHIFDDLKDGIMLVFNSNPSNYFDKKNERLKRKVFTETAAKFTWRQRTVISWSFNVRNNKPDCGESKMFYMNFELFSYSFSRKNKPSLCSTNRSRVAYILLILWLSLRLRKDMKEMRTRREARWVEAKQGRAEAKK